VAEVIGHRQVFEPASIAQAVGYEIHTPHLIDRLGQLQWHSLVEGPFTLLAFTHSQIDFSVKAVHQRVIHTRKVPAQQVMHPAIAKPTTLIRNISDSTSQGLCLLTGQGWVEKTVSAQSHKSASAALGELKLLNHLADRITLDLWG
jgi:hypothetical protein